MIVHGGPFLDAMVASVDSERHRQAERRRRVSVVAPAHDALSNAFLQLCDRLKSSLSISARSCRATAQRRSRWFQRPRVCVDVAA